MATKYTIFTFIMKMTRLPVDHEIVLHFWANDHSVNRTRKKEYVFFSLPCTCDNIHSRGVSKQENDEKKNDDMV
jgi:hypothetical protein